MGSNGGPRVQEDGGHKRPRVGRLAQMVMANACVNSEEGWNRDDEWDSAADGEWPWSDEEGPSAARMAGDRKRRKGAKPRGPRNKPALLAHWRDHVARTCVIPVGMMKGLLKREVYTQLVLAVRDLLGTTRKPKPRGLPAPDIDDGDDVGAARVAGTGRHASCTVNGLGVRRVILDPGSSHSLIDRACVDRLRLRIAGKLPGIELANGQTAPVYRLNEEVTVEVHGVRASVPARCVDASGAYDVLLGQDWLALTHTSAQFDSQVYALGTRGARVRQRGRQLEVVASE